MVIVYVQASGIKGPQVPTIQQASEQDHKQAKWNAYGRSDSFLARLENSLGKKSCMESKHKCLTEFPARQANSLKFPSAKSP